MKEIKLFESWADNLINESSSVRMGTPMSAMADRPLPREHDIQYKAQRARPELSPEQALALYIADQLEANDKEDKMQDKQLATIDKEIDGVEDEVHHVEKDEEEIKSQLDRLVQLIKTAN